MSKKVVLFIKKLRSNIVADDYKNYLLILYELEN